MKVNRIATVNQTPQVIPVEFLVLHYTAVDLHETLAIFTDPDSGASAHLVIDTDGQVYELVECLDGRALRAWHAGISRWQHWQGLNDYAIGIELVNFNGNVFPFTDAQYHSLHRVLQQLQAHYPQLHDPERIIGHEHIAGFRGKADPGLCFDWPRFFRENYPDALAPQRSGVCPVPLQERLLQLRVCEPESPEKKCQFWQAISLLTETAISLIEQTRSANHKTGMNNQQNTNNLP